MQHPVNLLCLALCFFPPAGPKMAQSGGQEHLQAARLCCCVSVCPWDGAGMGSLLLSPRGEQHSQPHLTQTCPEETIRIVQAAKLPPNRAATTQLTFSWTENSEMFIPAFSCLSYHLWYQIGGRMAMSVRCSCPEKRRNLQARKCVCVFMKV